MAERSSVQVDIDQAVCDAALDFELAVKKDVRDILERLVAEHCKQVDGLVAAIEQLHRTAHGIDHGLRVCPHEPCAGVWRFLPAVGEGGGDGG